MAVERRSVEPLLARACAHSSLGPHDPEASRIFLREQCRVLVVGAGGLGCEILANLALMGFGHIDVIDMDTIDVSNLNRQFLFRETDIGKPKSTTAAAFVKQRIPGVFITPHVGRIQDKDESFYMQFHLILCGLDSVEARRWINATLVHMVDDRCPESLKPLIDGGTEGLKGQARVILPTITSCYECSLDMLPKRTVYPVCTIANTPRLPEHCIEWASVLEWPRVHPEQKLDTDNPEHIQWVMDTARTRAQAFQIDGITWTLTQGVIKNIIPAIASTNAIIAAACTQEAFKIATSTAPYLNNYMMYAGNEGMYTYTFDYAKRPDCPVCGTSTRVLAMRSTDTLERLVDLLKESPDMYVPPSHLSQCKRPVVSSTQGPLYYAAPKALEEATRVHLGQTLAQLGLQNKDILSVTDPQWPFALQIELALST
ncbi:E1 ubiquitin-activating enzyme [Malassezia nana]|uniref:NEDD8-activating enzyme E1 catalytic subunit n=1 Tax=Malassezia nana TaxID=180528 RepID=A0AAF0EL60_9BASI|nr:E1 ubiquitin-activating enzyme [Malassezia nana]